MAHETRLRDPSGPLAAWRANLLRSAGFDEAAAARVAGDPSWDLHALIGLTERGCPPHLAVRILAPLEDDAHGW
jgi:hypothetical protein